MSLLLRLSIISVFSITLASCGNNSENSSSDYAPQSFSLELVDSIEVAYLGDMQLVDYDVYGETYLIKDKSNWKYIEVNEEGEIVNQNHMSSDGLNAIPNVTGLGYLDGGVTVLTQTDGYYKFQDSAKMGEIAIPYPYRTVIFYSQLGVFSEENILYYPKPWPETIDLSMNNWDFYKQLYELPLIESLDLATSDTLAAVNLPPGSAYLDGRVHGFLIPTYFRIDDLLLLSLRIRPEIYVYQKDGIGFKYQKTVEVDIPGWEGYDPVEKENAQRIYEGMRSKQIGMLHNLVSVDGYYLAIYRKGIPEEKMPDDNGDQAKVLASIRKADPFFVAVFDKNFKQVATDLPLPSTSNFTTVVNANGELVVSKDASLSDTEDDGIILYKLKLTEQ